MKKLSLILFLLIFALTACQPAAPAGDMPTQALVLEETDSYLLLLMDAKAPGKGSNTLSNLCTMGTSALPASVSVDPGELLTFTTVMTEEVYPCRLEVSDVAVQTTNAQLPSHIYAANINHAIALQQFGSGVLIDVRTPEEYQSGHLPGAVLLPVDQISAGVEALVPDKSTPVMVYCRSGNRSATAAKALNALGYTVIFDLGGINGFTGSTVTGMEPGTP